MDTTTDQGVGHQAVEASAGRPAGMPGQVRLILVRRLAVSALLVAGSIVWAVGSILALLALDHRLTRNQRGADATVVWVHRGLFNSQAVRVSYQTRDGRAVSATVHTGIWGAWLPGDTIQVSYNTHHPSAVVYGQPTFDDPRLIVWEWSSGLALLSAAVALTVLTVRLRRRSQYQQCFADPGDAIPATFLRAAGKPVTRAELETESEWGPWPLAVRILRGQHTGTFTRGAKVELRDSGRRSEKGCPVVLSSSAGERHLLGRRRGPALEVAWAQHRARRAGWPDKQIALSSRPQATDDGTVVDIADPVSDRPTPRSWNDGHETNGGTTIAPAAPDRSRSRRTRQAEPGNEFFAELPGTHIVWRRVSRGHFQQADKHNDQAHADIHRPWLGRDRVHIAGRIYRIRWGRSVHDTATGAEVLHIDGRNFNHKSGATIRLADGRLFLFPVSGNTVTTAVMTAVDESGRGVIMFRKPPRESVRWVSVSNPFKLMPDIEAAIHPDWPVTADLLLIIVVAAPFLDGYFESGGGGG